MSATLRDAIWILIINHLRVSTSSTVDKLCSLGRAFVPLFNYRYQFIIKRLNFVLTTESQYKKLYDVEESKNEGYRVIIQI